MATWLGGKEAAGILERDGDLAMLDSIYLRCVASTAGDQSEALLLAAFTTLPYRTVPLRLPIAGITFTYPLLSPPEEEFKRKLPNLPKRLYRDSPAGPFGDKDKGAHFFAAAFLGTALPGIDLSELIGYFVEVFEETFEVEAGVDNRDLRTNRLGATYAALLRAKPNALPSEVFQSYNNGQTE